MNVTVICVGKLKEKYWTQAMAEYTKRLSKYCTFSVLEVKEEKAPEGICAAEEDRIKESEGKAILSQVKKGSFLIALDVKGKQMSSEELAEKIELLAIEGKSNLVFVIGGSIGLSAEVLENADVKLSFSPMTFPHQMMRVILAEQIYRAFKIIKHEVYHK